MIEPSPPLSAAAVADASSRSFVPILACADHSVRLSQLYWTDAFNDASSEAGKAATALKQLQSREKKKGGGTAQHVKARKTKTSNLITARGLRRCTQGEVLEKAKRFLLI